MTAAYGCPTSDLAKSLPTNNLKRTSTAAPRTDPPRARSARRRLLYIFSGPARPHDGFAALAADVGFDTTQIDLEQGGAAHDMRLPANRARVLLDLRAGEYCGVLVATPCTTFAIARGNRQRGALRWTISSTALPSTPAAIVRSDGGGGLIIILSYYRECCLVYREWE